MIYTLPFIAAVIGWFTNFLAVKMLFHPREKVRFLFFEIQGIFPKRQKVLAEKLGQLVARELVSVDDLKKKFNDEDNLKEVQNIVSDKLDEFMEEKFPVHYPLLAVFVTDTIKDKFKAHAMSEINSSIPAAIESYMEKVEKNLDIEGLVYEKVSDFSSDKLEKIVFLILKDEFKFIELVGAILGFVIGLIQVGLVKLAA